MFVNFVVNHCLAPKAKKGMSLNVKVYLIL